MAVRIHDWQNPFGVVELQGMEIVGYEEKPIVRTHINAGVYVVEPYVIGLLTRDSPLDMPALFELVQNQEMKAIAYPIHEPWIDIGRPNDFLRASSGSIN
jgi:NDP-sugar pyrophosphorylase family protein